MIIHGDSGMLKLVLNFSSKMDIGKKSMVSDFIQMDHCALPPILAELFKFGIYELANPPVTLWVTPSVSFVPNSVPMVFSWRLQETMEQSKFGIYAKESNLPQYPLILT